MILAEPFHAGPKDIALAVTTRPAAEWNYAANAALILDDRRYSALVALIGEKPRRSLEMSG